MNRPNAYTQSGAESFAKSVQTLFWELENRLGADFAREFVISFYEGAGRGEGS